MGFVGGIVERVRREPAVLTGVILSVALLVGVDLDPDVVGEAVAVLAPLVGGLVTRWFVTPARRNRGA